MTKVQADDDQGVHLDAPDSAVLHHPDQEKCSSRPKIIQSPTITGAVGRCDEFHDTNNKLPILTSFQSGTNSKPCQGQAEQDPARDRADDHQPGQVDEPLEDQGHDVPDQASAGSDHPDQQHDQEGPHQAQDSAGERTMDQADDHQPAPDGLTLHHPDQEKCSSMPQYIIQSPTITGAVGRCDEFHNNHIIVPILTSSPPGTPTNLHPGIADIDETNSEEARAEPWPSLGHDQAVKDAPSQAEHLPNQAKPHISPEVSRSGQADQETRDQAEHLPNHGNERAEHPANRIMPIHTAHCQAEHLPNQSLPTTNPGTKGQAEQLPTSLDVCKVDQADQETDRARYGQRWHF